MTERPRRYPTISNASRPCTVSPYSVVASTVSRCAPGAKSAGRRAVQMCDDTSAFTHGFVTAALRANSSSTNGSLIALRYISMGGLSPMRRSTFDFGPPSNTLATSVAAPSVALAIDEASN